MIGLIQDIFNIADRYGLKILNIDQTYRGMKYTDNC